MVWNYTIYLLYGLAFFTLGVAIFSRDIRLSELGIARILWLLASFGVIHGFHEWLELLSIYSPGIGAQTFVVVRLIFVSISFVFLLYFGLLLNIITVYGDQALRTTPAVVKAGIGVLVLILVAAAIYLDLDTAKDMNVRRLVAFPGAILSGTGLIIYSRTVRSFSERVARNFILAGTFMIGYAVFTGVIPSDMVIPALGTKIIVLRGISALLIMFFTIRALSVFSLEQRKIINEQLQRFAQSEKLTSMGILAAGIAHEINNPLTNALLNLEMLKDLVDEDEKITRKIESIDRNITRASSIASELLHFSRQKELDLEPINLNEVIKSARNLLKNQELNSIIEIKPGNIPEVRGIAHKLEEVFINLLLNSIDACTAEDIIEVETMEDSGNVVATVTDTGHGMDPEVIARAFDPFFTTKEIGKGTGLGLSVCYNIIKQHDGDLSLVSSEFGGTVVTINLPAMKEDDQDDIRH